MPENYIRRYAANILSYQPFIEGLELNGRDLGEVGVTDPAKIFRETIEILNRPDIDNDAQNVLEKLRKLYEDGEGFRWPDRVEKYVQSIFPPPIISPFVPQKDRPDLRWDETYIDSTVFAAERAINVSRWMIRLPYLFTKEPKDWMEWELLRPRPHDAQATQRAVDALQDECGEWLQYFCDSDRSLRAPSYNEISLFLERIVSETDDNRRQHLAYSLGCLQNFFLENSVYRLIFEGSKRTQWEPDFFRFERPDMIEGKRAGSGVGTVRVVMPASCASVGLKNHFPREAYRVVAEQVSPLRKNEPVASKSTGISDKQLLRVISAVMEDTAVKGKKLFNKQVMAKLDEKSEALYGDAITAANEAFSKARFYRERLGRISEKAGKPNVLVDYFNEWLDALKKM